jgi:DNA-directed RNA polymerase specialized sigma24 family protein
MEPLAIAPARTHLSPGAAQAAVLLPVTTHPDGQTLSALFASEESGLLRYAIGLVGRRMIAEELVQETFLRLHQVWGEVENPRGWLYRSLRNLALNHLRDRPKESELHAESVPHELPPGDRDLIQLKYRDNLKYDEISRRTGLSIGNVGYRLHHLLKSLADGLRQAGIEGSHG